MKGRCFSRCFFRLGLRFLLDAIKKASTDKVEAWPIYRENLRRERVPTTLLADDGLSASVEFFEPNGLHVKASGLSGNCDG